MVNRELFLQIAGQIETEPHNYDQSQYGICGTQHCIAGWAIVFEHGDNGLARISDFFDLERKAARALGISSRDSEKLFATMWKPRPDLTVPDALRLIANGASVAEVSANG